MAGDADRGTQPIRPMGNDVPSAGRNVRADRAILVASTTGCATGPGVDSCFAKDLRLQRRADPAATRWTADAAFRGPRVVPGRPGGRNARRDAVLDGARGDERHGADDRG